MPLKSRIPCERVSLSGFCKEAEAVDAPDADAYREPNPDALAELIFTTGTTGKPKGAMLIYSGIEASTKNTWTGIGMRSDDCVLNPLPLNHSFGMRVLRACLYGRVPTVLQNGFSFPQDTETNLKKYSCTGLVSVPATIENLYRSMEGRFREVMGNLRYIEISAGFLPVNMKRTILEALPETELHNTWGSSESGGAVFLNARKYPDKLGSIGRPITGVEFKAIGQDGNTVSADTPDKPGRMALKGQMVMAGYYGLPEESGKALSDGWLYTNDLVWQDKDGFLYMLGRADDIINVGGEKVSPVEVENAALEYEGICDCACIGVPDPDGTLGQVPVLFVIPEHAEFREEQCERFLLSRLERHKLPRRYLTVDRLPRNRMQKLDRKALRTLYDSGGKATVSNEVIRAIRSRRSIREFTEEPIPQELLETIVKAGTYAPSGHNMQTWRFTVIQNPEMIVRMKDTVRKVANGKKNVHFYGFQNPAALILVSNDRRNPDGIQDSSCAAQNIMLAAHSLGLGSVWLNPLMTICDEPEIRELLRMLEIPETHTVWAMLALGWPAQEGKQLAKKTDVVRWF